MKYSSYPLRFISICLPALAMAILVPAGFAQVRPTHRPDVPNFDTRSANPPKGQDAAQQQNGLAHIKGQLPSAEVDFDELLGTPRFIRSREGFLTGPNGQGRAVSAKAAQAIAPGDPHGPIKAFLNEHNALFGHGAEVLDSARVKRDYTDAHNGLHTVVWEQNLDGTPIYKSVLMGHITKKGELTSLSSTFVSSPAASANAGTPGRAGLQSSPPISAQDAIILAAKNINATLSPSQVTQVSGPSGDGDYLVFKTPQEAYVRLVWLPLHRSSLRLAWEVMVCSPVTHERFLVVIDAQNGKAHLREGMTFYISDASYNVYTSDSPSPFSPGLQTPGTFQPPLTNRVLVTTPALDTTASPDGWIPDGSNTTTGNNCDAFVDRNFNQQPDRPRPVGNPNRVFDFPLDLTQDPTNYIDASTTELFYKCNWYHDKLYELGFTEAAGNFQQNNFGRGGIGNDNIIDYVQSGADVGFADNASFGTPPDGFHGECNMFIFDFPIPQRDGSLDSDVFFHEFTHGTSWRLVGGGNNLGNLQGDGMGEGWSDFFALSLSSEPGDDPNAAYAAGGYVTYQFGFVLTANYYFGIRHFPYCTDMTKNPFTFKDIDPTQISPHTGVPRSPIYPFFSQEASEVHHQGEIWCSALWEVRANLIAKYGTTNGNQLALQLVTDGFKLTPARPTFLQARDAILLADRIDNNGVNSVDIWRGFAKRGMGASAVAPGNNTTTGVIEAYDFPSLSVDKIVVSGGNGNGIIDNNECNDIFVFLLNNNNTNATHVSAQLFATTKGALIAQGASAYPDLLPGATNANSTAFKVSTAPTFLCGTPVDFTLILKTDQETRTNTFTLPSGTNGLAVRFDNSTVFQIPDNDPGGVDSTISVTNVIGVVGKVGVSAYITHPFDSDLTLLLISPDGVTNTLSAKHGGSGANYGVGCSPDSSRTTFDDVALVSIGTSLPPFAGSFRPDSPLAIFTGKSGTNVNGTWRLRVVDSSPFNFGTLQCWSLFLSPALCLDGGGECPGVDLAVTMSENPEPVVVGQNLVYTITVTNSGPDTARNTVIAQSLANSVGYVSATVSQGNISQSGGLVTANLGNIPALGTATATVTVTNRIAGIVSSTATVNSSNPDFDLSNNTITLASHVNAPTSDLAAGLTPAPNPALVGSTLTYTVSVTNNGPSTATGVVASNNLPASVGITSVTPSQGSFTVSGNTVVCNFGSLASQTRATAAINVIPGTPGTVLATTFAFGSTNQLDPVAGNNVKTASVIVNPASDLAIGISAPAAVVVRSNFTYSITATNRGPNDASGVVINQNLPASSRLVSSNSTQGTFTLGGGVLACNVGSLPVGAGVNLTVVVAVTNAATVSSTANVSSSQADSNPTNNSATAVTLVSPPFVTIVPAGSTLVAEYFTNGTPGFTNGAIDIGETVQLSLSLKNIGNASTTNNVSATLLTNSSVLPAQPNTSSDYDLLAPGGSAKVHLFTFTAAGTNGGTVTAVLSLKDGANDLGTASFSFVLPSVSKFANTNRIDIPTTQQDQQQPGPASPYPSSIVVSGATGLVGKVTVTLSNLNHTFPHDINLLLVSPTGGKTLLMSDAADGSSANGVNLTFDDSAASTLPGFGQITSGSWQPSVYDSAAVLSSPAPAGPYGAALAFFNGTDPNGTWSLYAFDDTSGDFGNVANGWSLAISTANPLSKPTDLSVSVVSAPASTRVGDTVTNIFTVTNAGPSKSGGLWFTNLLPAGTLLVSATNSALNPFFTNGNALSCYLGDALDVNASATITLVLSPIGTNSPISLSGTVVATNGAIDLNQANNTASTVTTVLLPFADIAVTQSISPNPAVLGFPLTNTVRVTNAGPGIAFGVLLTNTLPAGAGLFSTVPSGTYLGGKVTLQLGDIAANTAVTAIIVVTNTDQTPKTNISSVATVSIDSNSVNNSATNSVTVASPFLQIASASAVLLSESGPKNGFIDIGETNTVDLYLQNVGNIPTTNLVATLLATNGVLLNSGAQIQTYGSLGAGALVHRPFTFTAGSGNGGNVLATLRLQDGSVVTNVTFAILSRAVFSNTFAITIPDHGTAVSYPSTITISGMNGVVANARATLTGVNHTFPRDINALLANPGNSDVLLMSHAGGAHSLPSVTLTFDDAAANSLSASDQITSGAFKPTAYGGAVILPSPAPDSPYGTALAGVAGGDPNGDWSLYIFDDTTGDAGNVASGWTLDLTTTPVIAPPVLSASFSGGQVHLAINSQPGTYVIYGSWDLSNWIPLSTNTASTSGSIAYTDPNSQNYQLRYYRAVRLLP